MAGAYQIGARRPGDEWPTKPSPTIRAAVVALLKSDSTLKTGYTVEIGELVPPSEVPVDSAATKAFLIECHPAPAVGAEWPGLSEQQLEELSGRISRVIHGYLVSQKQWPPPWFVWRRVGDHMVTHHDMVEAWGDEEGVLTFAAATPTEEEPKKKKRARKKKRSESDRSPLEELNDDADGS